MLLASSLSGGVLAQKDKKNAKKNAQQDKAPATAVDIVKGESFRMASTKLAKRLTRVRDAAGDQSFADGSAAPEAPAFSDIKAAWVAPADVTNKLLSKMEFDYPPGVSGTFYGPQRDWTSGDRAVFVAVQMAKKLPAASPGQQVEVGLSGDAAAAVLGGAAADARVGVERFSLSGLFSNGAYGTGTTDVSGREPEDPVELYNMDAGVIGFYDRKKATWYLIMPRPKDAKSVTVAVRTSTANGEIVDRLELAGGGHHLVFADPVDGYRKKSGVKALACRSLEAFSADSSVLASDDPDATFIRYTVGGDAELLAPVLEAGDSIPMLLKPIGSDAEPLAVDAQVTAAPSLGAVSLTMEVPPGQWAFATADESAFRAPNGQRLIDHSSLTGRAGVRTEFGRDGFAAGDPDCGRWDLGADVCTFVPAAEMAGLLGQSESDIEQTAVQRPDGTQWCVGLTAGTTAQRYIAGIGTSHYDTERFSADVATRDCQAYPLGLGAEGINFDCGSDGYENVYVRVAPDATAADDPAGGLLISIDMAVDADQAYGERYDGDAALEVFGGIVADVAAEALPAGTKRPEKTTEQAPEAIASEGSPPEADS
jgi:hypothetical protein